MSLVDRIKVLSSEKGLNIKQLEQMLGFANGSIRRWNNSSPSADKLQKVANFLNVSCEHLLTGKEATQVFSISQEDQEWLDLIHQLPTEKMYEFKGELKGYLRYMEESAAVKPSNKTGTENPK